MVVERVRPAQRRPLFARGHRQDIGYAILNVSLVVPLMTALTLSFVEITTRAFPWIVLPWPSASRLRIVVIAVIFVVMDGLELVRPPVEPPASASCGGFHEATTRREDMNGADLSSGHTRSSTSRISWPSFPGSCSSPTGPCRRPSWLRTVSSAFAHSNTDLDFGPLRRIFVSPNFHRIHHRRGWRTRRQPRLRCLLHLGPAGTPRRLPGRDNGRHRHGSRRPRRLLTVEQAGVRPALRAVDGRDNWSVRSARWSTWWSYSSCAKRGRRRGSMRWQRRPPLSRRASRSLDEATRTSAGLVFTVRLSPLAADLHSGDPHRAGLDLHL